jgi:uncharacterized membrane protein YebE (DUF533 family)
MKSTGGMVMKKSIVFGIMAGVLLAMGVGIACAGSIYDPGINRREWRQEKRIERGIASGRLTPREARALEREQSHIRYMEARMKSDGHLTARERLRLHHRLNVASRDIWRLNHNVYRR